MSETSTVEAVPTAPAGPVYYLTASGKTGASLNGKVPADGVVCTFDQYKNSPNFTVSEDGKSIIPVVPSLSRVQTLQIALLNNACKSAIVAGFPATINGVDLTITQSLTDQQNAQSTASISQVALTAAEWQANQAYGENSIVKSGGVYYITFSGGTSEGTAPTFPTEFQKSVSDGSIIWYKLGFWIGTSSGNIMVDPTTAIALFAKGISFISSCRSRYEALKAAVNAATTTEAVTAITWT